MGMIYWSWLDANGFERFSNDTHRAHMGNLTLNIHDIGNCYHVSAYYDPSTFESAKSKNPQQGTLEAIDKLIADLERDTRILKNKREKLAEEHDYLADLNK